MGGLGMALAGALSGFGAGMAEQGKLDIGHKHQIAMEKLRSTNQMAESDRTAGNNDRNRAAEQARGFKYDVARDRGKSTLEIARDREKRTWESGEKANDRTHATELARQKGLMDIYGETYGTTYKAILEKSLANGEIKSVEQDDKGNFFVIKNDGSVGDIGVVGTPKSQQGGLGGDLVTTSGKPAAAPANPGLNRRSSPAAPAPAANKGSYNNPTTHIVDPGEALRFVKDPANKGKWFIGPNGQTLQVK
jgi:hypothetical protein